VQVKFQFQYLLYLFSLTLVFVYSVINPLSTDEAEHIHFAWLNSHGYRPFVDYWQHHMPLIWDILAPIFILDNNIISTISIRLIIFLIISFSAHITLNKLVEKNYSLCAIFILTLIFPLARLDIRPELLVFPFYCYFLIYFSKENQEYNLNFITIILLFIALLLTPRFIAVFVVFFIGYIFSLKNKNVSNEIKKCLIIMPIILFVIHISYDYRDLLFFVFVQSSEYSQEYVKGDYFSGKFGHYIKTYLILLIFFINTILYTILIRKNRILIFLSFLQIVLCLIEAGPYAKQATFLLSFLNFVFLIRIIKYFNYIKFFNIISLLLFVTCFYVVIQIKNESMLYNQLTNYERKILSCDKNKNVQSLGFSRISDSKSAVHPVFTFDATYFGFYQSSILNNAGFKRVIEHNKDMSRSIKYISDNPPYCLGNMSFFYKIKLFVEKIVYKN
jgi:hypothetical protein